MFKKKKIQLPEYLSQAFKPNSTDNMAIFFSPGAKCERIICNYVALAQKEIKILAYTIDSIPFLNMLLEAAKNGVSVTIVMDYRASKKLRWNLGYAIQKGLNIYATDYFNAMHCKVLIIDNLHTITGSYNFTANAQNSNLENLIVFRDNTDLNHFYTQLFNYALFHSQLYKCLTKKK